ncbi:MAG: hypothetical protein LCI00_05205 [Chloroflexi bacterium]|nr:hypothetical protein [Chloroflexota bacterium]MCC6896450.1 hypothetical protein [Anaerolineae bacterium]
MEHLKSVFSVVVLGSLLLFSKFHAQDANQLLVGSPVSGQITASNTELWIFNAVEGEVLSFSARNVSGNLDPQITITNSRGDVIIENDDYDYPESQNALLEAITIPRTDTYTVTVSGVGGSSGEYALTMLNGFSQTAWDDNFNGDLVWQDVNEAPTDSAFTVAADSGQLVLAIIGAETRGVAVNPNQDEFVDFYATVKVNVSSGPDGWTVGMTLRQQDPEHYYLLNVRSRGEWRFIRHENGTDITIRDWTVHPALANSTGSFSLGAMVSEAGFDFFYNNVLFGRLSDTALLDAGNIGLSIQTGSSLSSQITAAFDDLLVSVPTLSEGERIIPLRITVGQPAVVTRDIQRQALISATGQLSLTVPESFVESSRPGVERVPLARGAVYGNMALGTTVSWEAVSDGQTGCGLILQAQDDTNYTLAFIDRTGAYGVSQRQGDTFHAGIFAENPALTGTQHALVVIVRADQILYYVDGFYGGSMTIDAAAGAIGNAVVNFEPIRTSCSFRDTWVWNWDN